MTSVSTLSILTIFSVFMFVGSLLFVPWLVGRLPRDYFLYRRSSFREIHPVAALILAVVRNVIGIVLLAAGVAMLVLPGQGLLTLLIGLSLTDFPGKHKLVDLCVQQPRVQRLLNWIRRKEGRDEFVFK